LVTVLYLCSISLSLSMNTAVNLPLLGYSINNNLVEISHHWSHDLAC
jgi:hypothetical protein